MKPDLSNPQFWDEKYSNSSDNWTLNSPNPVLVQIIEQGIIFPPGDFLAAGFGKGFDPVYAAKKGFNVTAVDFSSLAVKYAKDLALKENVKMNIAELDLFDLKSRMPESFDIIFEYTTFCAVDKERKFELFENLAGALKPGGKLVTIPFPLDGRPGGPPFALDMGEFFKSASKLLSLQYFSRSINSVKPRKGKEVLMIFVKRK